MRLRFARRGSDTILSRCRYTLPLQALTPITLEDGTAFLMLLNPTGGMLGGDRLLTMVTQEAGTSVCLTTPSATRVYRAAGAGTIQEMRIELKEGASLEYLPGHLIPHAGAVLRQSLRVEMGRGSKAVISDALAAGRVAHGERWSFKELNFGTEVLMSGKLVFMSRAKIEPGAASLERPGVMEGFNYAGLLAAFSDADEDWSGVATALNKAMSALPGVTGGVSLTAHGGCVARYLTRSAIGLAWARKALWAAARESLLRLAPFDLRNS